ncbi:MAG: 4Fe-4S binding protein [Bacteroides sp.]|nr:4Fe-4S binding protein [Bacteroides sp.]
MNKKRSKFIAINPRNCVACWGCVEACPTQALGKVEFLWHRHIVFKNADACIACGQCIKICKNQVFKNLK